MDVMHRMHEVARSPRRRRTGREPEARRSPRAAATPLLRVVLPAAKPGVVAAAIYAFMTAWGEVLFASVLTGDEGRTLAVELQGYATQSNIYWNQVMAASVIVSVPVVAGFLLLQRYPGRAFASIQVGHDQEL